MIRLEHATLICNDEENNLLLDAALDTEGDRPTFSIEMGDIQFDAEDCREAAQFFNGLAQFLESLA